MDHTVQILQDLVRNAHSGESAVEQLLTRVDGEDMEKELRDAQSRYHSALEAGEKALREAGGKSEPTGLMEKAGMWLGVQMATMTDNSNTHIAEMVIQGADMGIIEMTKSLNSYTDARPEAVDLCRQFVSSQKEIIHRQKAFLKNEVPV